MPAFPCQTCQEINVAPLSDYEANEQTLPPVPLPFVETGTFTNEAVYFKLNCQGAEVPLYTGVLPSWITIDAANCRLVGAPGTFTGGGVGGVTQVNGVAQEFLDDFAQDAVINGQLTPPPLPVFPDTTSNEEVSIPLGTPAGEEAVYNGVLPGWITINNGNGTLVAAPGFFTGTSLVNANINANNALEIFLSDSLEDGTLTFETPVPPPPVGPAWSTLAWAAPTVDVSIGTGIFAYSPDSATGSSFVCSSSCDASSNRGTHNTASLVNTTGANSRISGNYHIVGNSGSDVAFVIVQVWQNAIGPPGPNPDLLGEFSDFVNAGDVSNSYTLDFVAPVAPIFLFIAMIVQADAGSSASADFSGTVSNLP